MRSPSRYAFTLIELLVVVAVIAILAAIALPNFLNAQARAKVAAVESDLRTITIALEAYQVDYNRPPYDGEPGFTYAGWVNVFTQVTTPVAYMTSLTPDVFQAGVAEPTRPNHTHYIGNKHLYDFSTAYWNDIGNDPVMTPVWKEKFGESTWKMSSPGPDRAHSFGLSDAYDPTNGTISFGDIIRSNKGNGK
ncbi:MAG: prepilin-type N-terminal cleavage/methylation domain-containing protein [Candidatus Sumerlaeia bacterium]|nr:prepilin-type N-terminal cleavage/methylation domain-containing protein [Candidatus Sumerlaeia bacterium]